MIEKLKLNDPTSEFKYIDEDGVSYRSKSEYLQSKILGFCGCGNPNDVMMYVLQLLNKIKKSEFGNYEDMPYMFFMYWADYNGFAEHGTTIRCSWITDKGRELISDIVWCLKHEHNL